VGEGPTDGRLAPARKRRARAARCRRGTRLLKEGERGSLTCGAKATVMGQWRFIPIQIQIPTNSYSIQIVSNFDQPKKDLAEVKQFEIKYGSEGFEEKNNFLHRNFFRSEMNFQ
jgi:hypothetical protein